MYVCAMCVCARKTHPHTHTHTQDAADKREAIINQKMNRRLKSFG